MTYFVSTCSGENLGMRHVVAEEALAFGSSLAGSNGVAKDWENVMAASRRESRHVLNEKDRQLLYAGRDIVLFKLFVASVSA